MINCFHFQCLVDGLLWFIVLLQPHLQLGHIVPVWKMERVVFVCKLFLYYCLTAEATSKKQQDWQSYTLPEVLNSETCGCSSLGMPQLVSLTIKLSYDDDCPATYYFPTTYYYWDVIYKLKSICDILNPK